MRRDREMNGIKKDGVKDIEDKRGGAGLRCPRGLGGYLPPRITKSKTSILQVQLSVTSSVESGGGWG